MGVFVCLFLGYKYTKKRQTSIKQFRTIKDGAIYIGLISLKVLQLGDCVFKTPGWLDLSVFQRVFDTRLSINARVCLCVLCDGWGASRMSQSAVTDPAAESCVGVRERAEAPACSKMRSSTSPSKPTCFTSPDSHSVTVSCTLAHSPSVCLTLKHYPPALSPHYTPTNKSDLSRVTLMEASCFHGMRDHKQSLCFLSHTQISSRQVIMSAH